MSSLVSFFLYVTFMFSLSITTNSFEILNDMIFKQIVDSNKHSSKIQKNDEKIIDGIYSEIDDYNTILNFGTSIPSEIYGSDNAIKDLKEPKIFTINVNNLNNVNYGIRAQIGSPQSQLFSLIIDIKSSNTWVQSTSCKNCNYENNRFNEMLSQTYKSFQIKKELNYTHTGVVGVLSEDYVGLNGIGQVPQNFVNVEEQWRIGNMYFDGILSLSFPGNYFIKLKERGIIAEAKLGLFFADINKNSLIFVGGISPTLIKDQTQIIWSNVNTISEEKLKDPSSPNWNILMKSFELNDKSIKEIENTKVIIDSMAYGIKIPKNHFFTFKDDFFPTDAECQFKTDNYLHCNCNNESVKNFPTLNFVIEGDKKLILKPNDYIEITTSSSDYSKSCRILISLNYNDDVWSFGTILLNIHYLILDYDNSKLGFFRLSGENFPDGGNKVILITIIIVAASAVLFTLVYILYKKFVSAFGGRNRNGQNVQNNEQNNQNQNQDYSQLNR